MPLSDENRALIERLSGGPPLPGGWYETYSDRLIEAARAEERAKAEGEVEELKREVSGRRKQLDEVEQIAGKAMGYPWFKDDQKNFPGATEANGVCIGEHVAETIVEELASNLAKAEARIAELTHEGEELKRLRDSLGRWHDAALSRATQAEELVREVLEHFEAIDALEVMEINPSNYDHELVCELSNNAVQAALITRAALAKLKAAPLQGGAQ